MEEILVFRLQDWRFGLPVADVQSLERAVTIVPLPGAPSVVEGLVDVHGRLVPVFDVRSRFRLPPKEVDPSEHLVIARAGGRLVALRVDRALEVVSFDPRDLEDPRHAVPGSGFVTGALRLQDGLVLIHDLATFLARAEAEQLDEAMERAATSAP